ncbi:hypothetical protein M3J09_003467 [Ascochyta lentis]
MEPTETVTLNQSLTTSTPPGPATSIQCRHCNRHLATTSVEDGFVPSVSQAQPCALCEPFLGLHKTLQTREQEHKALSDRGPKHHGRALAHERFRNSRVALENFLISIEAPNKASFDVAQAGFANRADPAQPDSKAEMARPDDGQRVSREEPLQVEQIPPTRIPPVIKRGLKRDSRAVNSERKRIKFTESVEERPEYRSFSEFYRAGNGYIPGRYVVAEGSEYLDTSGLNLTFTKFTGQKKVGSTFVDVVPKKEPQEGGGSVPAVRGKRRGNRKHKQGGQERDGAGHKGLDDSESKPEREKDHNQTNTRVLKNIPKNRATTPPATTRSRRGFDDWESEPEREKDHNQTNTRVLRNTRRSGATTPPVTTKPRRRVTQYDGQDDEAQHSFCSKPSLIVVLKTSYPAKEGVFAGAGESTNAPKRGEKLQGLSRKIDRGEATREAADLASTNHFVTNLQRDLSSLQQAIVTPRLTRIISTAVHDIFEVLEPLRKLFETTPSETGTREVGEVEEAVEDDCIYFDALDTTDKVASEDALHSTEGLQEVEDSCTWTDTAIRIEAASEINATLDSDADGLDAMPEHVKQTMPNASASEITDDDYKHDQWSPVLCVEVGLEETLRSTADDGVTESSTSTRGGSIESSRRTSSRSHNLSGLSTTETWSGEFTPQHNGTNSNNEGSVWRDPETPVEMALQDSPSEAVRNEVAGGLHQSFGELFDGQAEKQGVQAPCESEASNGSPLTSNIDQDVGTTLAGSGEARVEAQVDPGMAHNTPQVKTMSNQDLSADYRIKSDVEGFGEELLDASGEPSTSSLDLSDTGDKSYCTAVSEVEIQSGPLNKTCLKSNAMDCVVKAAIPCSVMEKNIAQDSCRRSLLQVDRKVSHAHEDSDDLSDIEKANHVWQPTDTATTGLQASKEYACAVPDPDEIIPTTGSPRAPAN